MALDESVKDDNDIVNEIDMLKFVYEHKISPYIEGKKLDYQTGMHEGFTLFDPSQGKDCEGGCCNG